VAHGRGLSDVIARYRSHAKAAGRAWRLTREQADVLYKTACFYCGASPSNGNRKTNPYPHNGIDRVENRKGYVLGNVVACCKDCNLAKRDLSASAFIALAHRVAAMHPPGQERR
jgi:hypothetical protein